MRIDATAAIDHPGRRYPFVLEQSAAEFASLGEARFAEVSVCKGNIGLSRAVCSYKEISQQGWMFGVRDVWSLCSTR